MQSLGAEMATRRSGVAPPKPQAGVAELVGLSGPGATYDATASVVARASAAAVRRLAAVPPAGEPASPRGRQGLVATAGAVRREPMGGGAARVRPVIGGPMSAGGRARLEPMTAAVRRAGRMIVGVRRAGAMIAAVHSEAISAGPVRAGPVRAGLVRAVSERTLGPSDPEMR